MRVSSSDSRNAAAASSSATAGTSNEARKSRTLGNVIELPQANTSSNARASRKRQRVSTQALCHNISVLHAYGFEVIEGPEIETEEYNFELLNIPPDHPSRDLWDTLYVAEPGSVEAGQPRPAEDGTILRTHTSPVQIRAMRSLEPPIRVIMPGRCFRYEAVDASHGFEFFQVEGLVVDRDTTMADLKGLLEEVARALYGRDVATRFRPGYYPFTEPSVAFDIACLVCGGEGCPACKRSGWMTILGAGMVHPEVLRAGGYDPDEFQGYAFGMGPDRMTMLRHGIGDIRLFFGADLRFATQFPEGR